MADPAQRPPQPPAEEVDEEGTRPDPRQLNGDNEGVATGRESEDNLLKRPRQDGWNSNT